MLFVITFLLSWLVWLVFSDKKRWRELFPVSIVAALLASLTDTITSFYPLWKYNNPHTVWTYILDDMGMYIVIPYLFIQWLPVKRSPLRMIGYWFIWTTITISAEWFFLSTDHMSHHKWWNIAFSYLSDWFLFWLFYSFHRLFKLELLSAKSNKL